MPSDPKIVMEEDVVRYVLAASAKQRRRLIAQLEYLQKHSFEPPDFQEKDRSGRWLNVKALKPFLITYWLDGPVDELRIVNIETVR
ncbi:MAG: hypothetical protein RL015_2203 [Verrucomicrobiota bacterium]|jgi:hypothetical protein